MCLVVFQKIFRKIFSGVWKMLQGKRQNQKNKHNTQIDAYDRRRSTTRCFVNSNPTTSRSSEAPRRFARSRSTARSRTASIAIGTKARSRSTAQSREAPRRRVRDLGSRSTALVLANGADWSLDVRTAPTGSLSPSCALALSLSLSLRNSFEVKIGMEIHFRSQSLFFLGQRKSISGKFYFPDQLNTRISRKAFPEMIFTQNKHSLNGLSVTC